MKGTRKQEKKKKTHIFKHIELSGSLLLYYRSFIKILICLSIIYFLFDKMKQIKQHTNTCIQI